MEAKIVDSDVYPLRELFADKFSVDFYQREYVWQKKQIEDLLMDLSTEFLKNWKEDHALAKVSEYDPYYYMGEIVLSVKGGQRSSIIDGQQRITTLTLLLIYLVKKYGTIQGFPRGEIDRLIYSDYYGQPLFNLEIEERKNCMLALYQNGSYAVQSKDPVSVANLVARYEDIEDCWNDQINDKNIVSFVYWIKEKVVFSKVWTNNDDFAYVIFETMNDRGVSLTQVEMLRSFLLANIDEADRTEAMKDFDGVIKELMNIKPKSKAEFEFFKIFFRGHYAEDLSQSKDNNSDFQRIGKEFHRWLRDKSKDLGLIQSADFVDFIDRIKYFAGVYKTMNQLISDRDTKEYLYLIVNSDYGFTLQPALLLASVCYNDPQDVIEKKIKVTSKYITKILSWRVWNHWMISQSAMEATIYDLCKKVRGKDAVQLQAFFDLEPVTLPPLNNAPTLNQQNKQRIRVLLALITEIVAGQSGEPDYMLNQKDIEVEHIWANHYDWFQTEFTSEAEFASVRNGIGDLLLLPKSFNASYGDEKYTVKVVQYFSQNILAQTLCENKYKNNPGFLKFKNESKLDFKAYSDFTRTAVSERAELYKGILEWNWKK